MKTYLLKPDRIPRPLSTDTFTQGLSGNRAKSLHRCDGSGPYPIRVKKAEQRVSWFSILHGGLPLTHLGEDHYRESLREPQPTIHTTPRRNRWGDATQP